MPKHRNPIIMQHNLRCATLLKNRIQYTTYQFVEMVTYSTFTVAFVLSFNWYFCLWYFRFTSLFFQHIGITIAECISQCLRLFIECFFYPYTVKYVSCNAFLLLVKNTWQPSHWFTNLRKGSGDLFWTSKQAKILYRHLSWEKKCFCSLLQLYNVFA